MPLPPLINLINESHVITSQISIMTARAIALHLGLNAWKEEWMAMHKSLPPSDEVLLRLIKNEGEHAAVSNSG